MNQREDYADLPIRPLVGPRLRRRVLSGVIVLMILVLLGLLGSGLLQVSYGVGSYSPEIIVDTTKPIRKVSYADDNVDDSRRALAEETADPRLFDWKDATRIEAGHFQTRITFTTRDSAFRHSVAHRPYLVVLIEFEDGSKTCRVVDLPPGLNTSPIRIDDR